MITVIVLVGLWISLVPDRDANASSGVAHASPASIWMDASPHDVQFVEVDDGVTLEVLDWGGAGEPLVFLAGHGHTAHVFDDFAPQLRDDFRVLAITRRGFGASSHPSTGYDLSQLVDDVFHVVVRLELPRVHLVGHSIAGDEITGFAIAYPNRVKKLVYLEAAYDRVDAERLYEQLNAVAPPKPTDEDLASPAAIRSYTSSISVSLPESEIRAQRVFDPDGRFIRMATADTISAAVATAVEHPRYAEVSVPALAIYAVPASAQDLFPFYPRVDRDAQALLQSNFDRFTAWAALQRRQFRREMRFGRAVEFVGARHYVFISHEAVLEEIRSFLLAR